jgi:hypothetical protein
MATIAKILTLEITPEQYLNNCSPTELKEMSILLQRHFYQSKMNSAVCRICGCTDDDCSQCIEKTGEPCYWQEPDLCSACASTTATVTITEDKPSK